MKPFVYFYNELSCEKQNLGTSFSIILCRFCEQYPGENPMQLNVVYSYNMLYIFYGDCTSFLGIRNAPQLLVQMRGKREQQVS